jgi:hypothetical protein
VAKCLCGHSHWEHRLSHPDKIPFCHGCVEKLGSFCRETWHIFKLDNLQLVEDLAEKKGLIK